MTPGSRRPLEPGKRSVTAGIAFDPVVNLRLLARDAERAIEQLEAALGSGEIDAGIAARSILARTLPWLRQAAEDPRHGQAERRTYLDQLEAAATPLVAQIPASTEIAPMPRRAGLFSGTDRVAAGGVLGTGGPLPHVATIQASFGRHDVSSVRAHTDEAARDATQQLGALAYATGSDVAFADGAPTLHTAAHEAAHVIQQRDGVAFKGAGGDATLEAHADAVADAVVAGRSAESLLDGFAGRAVTGTVQRKANPTEEYTLPDNVQDYAIAPDGWSALVRTSWVREDPKDRIFQMLRQMQRLGGFGWANEDGLRRAAAKTQPLDGTHQVIRYVVTLRTLAQMGLPPLSGAMVAREGDHLVVAIKIPGAKDDDQKESHLLGFDDLAMLSRAVETFTKLKVKSIPRVDGLVIRDGIIEVQITDTQAAHMFGAREWSEWKAKRKARPEQDRPADVSSELSLTEKMRVDRWLRDNFGIADTGAVTVIDRSTLNVIDEIDKNPDLKPILEHLLDRRSNVPGQVVGTFALEELLEAAKLERERLRLGVDKLGHGEDTTRDPSDTMWHIDGRIHQKGLVFADRDMTFTLELDWKAWREGRSANALDEFARRHWHADVEWAVERVDKPDTPFVTKHSNDQLGSAMTLDHKLALGPGESSGAFKVHAFMRSTHFAPKHFATIVEVKTEDARMDELRTRDLGDMIDDRTVMTSYEFDIGFRQKAVGPIWVSSKDTHGVAISGPLPKDFKHTAPADRKKARDAELELQIKLAAYLRKQQAAGKVGYNDAILAAEHRIKLLEETETKLANDAKSGWRPFEIRGTYLSHNTEVTSGGLELYGFYQVTLDNTPPKFDVKIRDLSNKLDSDLELTGDGDNFDDALREVFVKLAKAYPDGKVSVLAEDIVIAGALGAKPNGRSIGYELATTSAWKRAKSKVFDPVVQTLANAAAMAIMIIFPPSAAAIVPMLVVADIINSANDMLTKHQTNTLTFTNASIDLLQIGLDLLPAARGAKVLNPARTAIAEAKGNMRLVMFEAVQLAGQVVVMYERTRDQLVEIQDKQIAVMADKYRALIDLEKQVTDGRLNPSDPQLSAKRAEIEADAQSIRDTVTTTWTDAVIHSATFFVGAHLIGGHEEAADGARANRGTRFEQGIPREVTSLRKTGPNTFETERQNLHIVRAHYRSEGVPTSELVYDHANDKAHFEITGRWGIKTRVEAHMDRITSFAALHGATNKVVGHPISKTTGFELIEKLNQGDTKALEIVGIKDAGNGTLPHNHEFGLGELPGGEVVLVIGQVAAVDWEYLPGMTPRAHTHPPTAHDIPLQVDGGRVVSLAELLEPKPDAYLPREVVFPSGSDFIAMAHSRVDGHVVVTSFVLRGDKVMKAPAGDTGPRLSFTIYKSHEIGEMPDGHEVYKARVVGKSGDTATKIDHDVWVIADPDGGIFMTEPPAVILHDPNLSGN